MLHRYIRKPSKRFLRESDERTVTVYFLEPSEQPFEYIETLDVNDFHLHDDSKFYAFDDDYAFISGIVYEPEDIRVPKTCDIYGLTESGDDLIAVKFNPANKNMAGCLVIDKNSSWDIKEELISLNDFINGRGIYDVFKVEDVPLNRFENYDMDELKELGYDFEYERSEYVPSDVNVNDVPNCIDWGSYDDYRNCIVVYKGEIVR